MKMTDSRRKLTETDKGVDIYWLRNVANGHSTPGSKVEGSFSFFNGWGYSFEVQLRDGSRWDLGWFEVSCV